MSSVCLAKADSSECTSALHPLWSPPLFVLLRITFHGLPAAQSERLKHFNSQFGFGLWAVLPALLHHTCQWLGAHNISIDLLAIQVGTLLQLPHHQVQS